MTLDDDSNRMNAGGNLGRGCDQRNRGSARAVRRMKASEVQTVLLEDHRSLDRLDNGACELFFCGPDGGAPTGNVKLGVQNTRRK